MEKEKRNYSFRYIFTDKKLRGIIFRLRIYLAERLIPKTLNFYGREKIIGYIEGTTISDSHCGHNNEKRKHILSKDCWCNPKVEDYSK